jgi:hypothetical protein
MTKLELKRVKMYEKELESIKFELFVAMRSDGCTDEELARCMVGFTVGANASAELIGKHCINNNN